MSFEYHGMLFVYSGRIMNHDNCDKFSMLAREFDEAVGRALFSEAQYFCYLHFGTSGSNISYLKMFNMKGSGYLLFLFS